MYIKSIILDGFKSYGNRTEVGPFDNEFTAITGLNGTGKSNILDSICFVLGITNLTQVRATNLQELVYKNGQAGVIKATVTITFDSTDKENCPVGYEHCNEISVTRTVVVGGKNKYWINGRTVQNKKVTDLFCSIQMNVNNPNFLIMQGRITKVLNMKPMEILSMIEEAAGTSLYEKKREHTAQTIERKDVKLKEIGTMLKEELEPRIEKLREEQSQYEEFQKIVRDIDHLTHIHISYLYLRYKQAIENCEKNIKNAAEFIEQSHKNIENNENEAKQIEENCKAIQERIDGEAGGPLIELEKELAVKSKAEATAIGVKKSAVSEIETERRKLKSLQKNLGKDEEALKTKDARMAEVGSLFENLKNADETDRKAFVEAQKRFQALSAGLDVNEDGQTASLQEQLITSKTKITEAKTTIQKSEMELKHISKQLSNKKNQSASSDSNYQKCKQEEKSKEAAIEKLKSELSKINYEDGTIEHLEQQQNQLNTDIQLMRRELDRKGCHRFEVQYKDPEPGFDRRTVKGMLCKLFDVRDLKYAAALSTCGGGSLYNLVVDSKDISAKILARGQLQTRTTIIPISDIRGSRISADRVRLAQKLVGADKCIPAIDLIQYDPSLENVMKYVFGRTFICTDMNVAKEVTYHPQIMTRSITLDGDSVEPQGTLSGGSVSKEVPVLVLIADIKKVSHQMETKLREIQQISAEIARISPIAQKYEQMKTKLEELEYELVSIKKILAQNSYQKHQQEIEDMENEVENLKQTIEKAKEDFKTETAKAKETEANLADSKGYRERQLKEAKDNMNQLKKKSEQSQKDWKNREQEAETLRLEIEDLKSTIEKSAEEVQTTQEKIEKLEAKLNELNVNGEEKSREIEELKSQIKEQKNQIHARNRDLKHKMDRKEKLLKNNNDLALEIKKKESEMTKIKSENSDGYERITKLEREYKWIETDREYFGMKNTKYDYSKEKPEEAGDKLREAQSKRQKMEKRINVKAMMLLEREEEKLKEVHNRRNIIESDRDKIKSILKGLDKEKTAQVRVAWKEVDKNFGSIFSILLPGAQATLVPSDGSEFYHGLNIKVGFNGVWKESLNELSGGQRSLVALSLVLAMLKFKPAPIYILDEVDAALDMSHTQNIGNMLKTHFRNSQFIIVSLKDGMFNNANVLFKTKFENGVSGVIRTANPRR